ncbi:contractile injection system tape measure protein [Rufibacter hautae]|uniref:Uncharacterized protein n=1 Tax=Rufibacter hautae TaxID=2595005 RepID=A0A5B6TF49_9BACT|nr:contractile injection system tape measure protein [Rufibacter hautae]KAA3438748.1 hypothetical protein FOA19_16155 [Rufibacter hautae]
MHLIRKQIVEVEMPALEPALDLQQRVSRLVQERLNPALSAQFDRLAGPDQILRLDQVVLTVQVTDVASLGDELVSQVLQSFDQAFHRSAPEEALDQPWDWGGNRAISSGKRKEDPLPGGLTQVTAEEATGEAFLFFLQKGHLPWWAFWGSFEDFTAKTENFLAKKTKPQLQEFLRQVFQTKDAVARLAYQFPVDFLRALVRSLPEEVTTSGRLPQIVATLPPEVRVIWEQAGLALPQNYKKPNADQQSSSAPVSAEKNQAPAEETEGLYLQNAGLVLLAPFLETYLGTGGLVADHQLRDPSAAVHWLQYLVTGQDRTTEPELLLNKILCGVPLDTPVPAQVRLTSVCEKEAENVLRAVIRYWAVLKNTSPTGLRESFLQRDGRLTRKPDGDWLLQVEQKSYDMLLESLPWSYSLVKLPWMPQALWVDWA